MLITKKLEHFTGMFQRLVDWQITSWYVALIHLYTNFERQAISEFGWYHACTSNLLIGIIIYRVISVIVQKSSLYNMSGQLLFYTMQFINKIVSYHCGKTPNIWCIWRISPKPVPISKCDIPYWKYFSWLKPQTAYQIHIQIILPQAIYPCLYFTNFLHTCTLWWIWLVCNSSAYYDSFLILWLG